MKSKAGATSLECYYKANEQYAKDHQTLIDNGFTFTAVEVPHMKGKWTYQYRKNGVTYVARRKPDTTSWEIFPVGRNPDAFSICFTDAGELGGK